MLNSRMFVSPGLLCGLFILGRALDFTKTNVSRALKASVKQVSHTGLPQLLSESHVQVRTSELCLITTSLWKVFIRVFSSVNIPV